MKNIFYFFIVTPLEIFLFSLFLILKDFGLAIILFSIILRIFLIPISFWQFLGEKKIKKIKKRIDDETKNISDLLKKSEIINKIYKEENFNPLTNILSQLILIPVYLGIIIAIFNVLKKISNPYFLNFIHLTKPYLPLGIAVIILNFYYALKQPPESRKVILFLLGVISLIVITLPSALLLYFLINLLFAFLERKIFDRYLVKLAI